MENAFGILSNRFRIFHNEIHVSNLDTVDDMILACVSLHNFLIKIRPKTQRSRTEEPFMNGSNSICGTFQNISRMTNSNSNTKEAREMRLFLMDYFCNEGYRNWQQKYVLSCSARKGK